jgi:putative ABC transport system permease protein
MEARLTRGERVEDTQNARPEIRAALDRAQRFLGFSTLLTVVLAAVAIALAARRYMQRHLDACAVMRCLGLTQGGLLLLHARLFVYLALTAAVVGCLLGFLAHFGLNALLGRLLAIPLPAPGWIPLAQGGAVAAVLLLGFAFPPLLRLSQVPTIRVLRRELGGPGGKSIFAWIVGLLGMTGLILWVAGDLRLGLLASGGFLIAAGLFWAIGRAAVWLVGRLRRTGSFGWRQGLANLERHAASSSLQIAALAVGLMAMLLLTVTRGELLAVWQNSAPPDAPNHFIINIQPEQVAGVGGMLRGSGVLAELSPMIRGRLQTIDGRAVSAETYPDDDRAQRLIEREFNLSWHADLPAGNRLISGNWFAPGDTGLASVEEGLAETLGIKLGDELVFVVAGERIPVKVSNLRKLDWGSMRVNFFVLTTPGALDNAPASFITSFFLPEAQRDMARQLVQAYPNLTVVDIGAILEQLRKIMTQLAQAIQFVFLFTLVSGLVVLYAALTSALDERRHELAVMRALGARRSQLRAAALAELAIVGGLAGLIAAAGASVAGAVLAQQVFQFDLPLNAWLFPLAAAGGALLSIAVGWLGIARLLATPPLGVLRAGA